MEASIGRAAVTSHFAALFNEVNVLVIDPLSPLTFWYLTALVCKYTSRESIRWFTMRVFCVFGDVTSFVAVNGLLLAREQSVVLMNNDYIQIYTHTYALIRFGQDYALCRNDEGVSGFSVLSSASRALWIAMPCLMPASRFSAFPSSLFPSFVRYTHRHLFSLFRTYAINTRKTFPHKLANCFIALSVGLG